MHVTDENSTCYNIRKIIQNCNILFRAVEIFSSPRVCEAKSGAIDFSARAAFLFEARVCKRENSMSFLES